MRGALAARLLVRAVAAAARPGPSPGPSSAWQLHQSRSLNIHEFQGAGYLREFGVNVPKDVVAFSKWKCNDSVIARGFATRAGRVEVGARARQFLSSSELDIARGYTTRAGRVDIGARARQLQARRLWTIALCGTAVAGFVIVVLNTFQENLMYYITPSQALEKYFNNPTKNRFRLGGLVLEGRRKAQALTDIFPSVQHFKNSTEMEFVVTDLANEILVRYRGALPDLFREGHSVVAEGFVRPISQYPGISSTPDLHASLTEKAKGAGCYFAAIEVLAKHDEKYMPKEVAAAVAKNKALQEVKEMSELLETTTPQAVTAAAPLSSGVPTERKGVAQAPVVSQGYEISS